MRSEPSIHAQQLPWGLRVGMFANNGPSTRSTGRKSGVLALRSRRVRAGMQLVGGAALFVAGTGFGMHINRVLLSEPPGPQLARPEWGTRQLLADSPSGQRNAGPVRWRSFTEPASFHALGSVPREPAFSPIPTSAGLISVPNPAFHTRRPANPAQSQSLTTSQKPRAEKLAVYADRAHRRDQHNNQELDSNSLRVGLKYSTRLSTLINNLLRN